MGRRQLMGGGGKEGSGGGSGGGGAGLGMVARQINREITPLRQEYTQQLMEALSTGGVGARIPIMQTAVESSGRATSDAMKQVEQQLAQSGLGDSPYGQRILADTALGGKLAASGVQTDIMNQLLGVTPNYVLGSGNTVVSAYTGQAQAQNAEQANRVAMQSAWLDFLQNMAPQNSRASACCWIFLAAEGYPLHPVVRRYRDEHMNARNRRGYYRLAEFLVPRMVRSRVWMRSVQLLMTSPMTWYGRWVYGESRSGWLAGPLAHGWLALYSWLGRKGPYTRSNGEVI